MVGDEQTRDELLPHVIDQHGRTDRGDHAVTVLGGRRRQVLARCIDQRGDRRPLAIGRSPQVGRIAADRLAQVMQIAQRLAGFTLGAADLLRRAMGKKKTEEMAQAARRSLSPAPAERGSRGQGNAHLRFDGKVCRLRLQQVALGGLRPGVVSDGLA